MNTKMMKIITVMISVLMIITTLATSVYALTPGELEPNTNGTNSIKNVGQKIMGLLQTVGIVTAVIILMVLGIKYMMGSAEEKAEYKKTMIPYVIGAILIFGATTIANMVYTFANAI